MDQGLRESHLKPEAMCIVEGLCQRFQKFGALLEGLRRPNLVYSLDASFLHVRSEELQVP